MPPIVRLQKSRGDADCAILALAMYLDHSYEDILGVATQVTRSRSPHNRGMFTREIRAVAKRLGFPLRVRRAFDLDSDEGIVGFSHVADEDDDQEEDFHVAFVKNGLVFESGMMWEHELFCVHFSYKPVSLLERTP